MLASYWSSFHNFEWMPPILASFAYRPPIPDRIDLRSSNNLNSFFQSLDFGKMIILFLKKKFISICKNFCCKLVGHVITVLLFNVFPIIWLISVHIPNALLRTDATRTSGHRLFEINCPAIDFVVVVLISARVVAGDVR